MGRKAVRADWRKEGAYLNRSVTDEQRGRPPIFNPTLRAAAGWLFFRVARSLRIDLDMLVARALKNTQLTRGDVFRSLVELVGEVMINRDNRKDIQSIQLLPTIPLPRRSLQCASLPVASFEAPLSCLRAHPKRQGLRRSARAAESQSRYNRWPAHQSRCSSSVSVRSPH